MKLLWKVQSVILLANIEKQFNEILFIFDRKQLVLIVNLSNRLSTETVSTVLVANAEAESTALVMNAEAESTTLVANALIVLPLRRHNWIYLYIFINVLKVIV